MHIKINIILLVILSFVLFLSGHTNIYSEKQIGHHTAITLFIGDGMGETHRTATRWIFCGTSWQTRHGMIGMDPESQSLTNI
jgi:alkaline phosphatase